MFSNCSKRFYSILKTTATPLLSKTPKLDLSGVWTPLPTTFLSDGSIDYANTTANMEKYEATGLKGYLVFGSNGEGIMLSAEERAAHLKRMRCILSNSKRSIIAGVNAENTEFALKQCHLFSQSGADALLVVTPSFYKSNMNHSAFLHFYTEVANKSPKPVILYNVPSNTGVDISAETVILLAKHPNIVGMKESQNDMAKISRIVYETRDEDFQVVCGSGSLFMPSLIMGCVGGFMALANVLPEECVRLYNLVNSGQWDPARVLQGRFIEPNGLITRVYGVPGMKAALELFNYYGGPCRSPLLPVTPEQINHIRNAFTRHAFL